MTDAELREILDDDTKAIQENIVWTQSKSISHAVEFRVRVDNELGFALWVKGSYNRELGKTSFILFSQEAGRLLAVDAGADHHNRSCENVGELHLHHWNEQTRDREAIVVSAAPIGETICQTLLRCGGGFVIEPRFSTQVRLLVQSHRSKYLYLRSYSGESLRANIIADGCPL